MTYIPLSEWAKREGIPLRTAHRYADEKKIPTKVVVKKMVYTRKMQMKCVDEKVKFKSK